MKRNAKHAGSGGRLRLGLLLACAAAFLLVPASQAAAEHGKPHMKINIIAQPGASGEVTSDPKVTETEKAEGTPVLKCVYPEGGPQGGVCENAMNEIEPGAWANALKAVPGPGSKVNEASWEVTSPGLLLNGCEPGWKGWCFAGTLVKSAELIEVTVEFENETPDLKVNIKGINGGGGKVKSPWESAPEYTGSPPIACLLEEGATETTGTCENDMTEAEPGVWAVSLQKVTGEIAPNSKIKEWIIGGGGILAGGCSKEFPGCTVGTFGEDVEVTAVFECEVAECPPPVPDLKVNIKGINGGGGEIISPWESAPEFPGSPPIACLLKEGATETTGTCENEMTEVEPGIWAVSLQKITGEIAPNSKLIKWEVGGGGIVAGGCSAEFPGCLVGTEGEDVEVTAVFECTVETCPPPPTFKLTLNPPVGSGTLAALCDYGSGLEECTSLTEIPEKTGVEVTADPDEGNSVGTLTGTGSASGKCVLPGPEEAGTCSFEIKADSAVSAEFVAAESEKKHQIDPVFGEVAQQTTLETENCDEVDLGPFAPSKVQEEYANDQCVVTATATGTENELTAADETGGAAGPTDKVGHLTQEPGDEFTLNNALEVQGETAGLSGSGADTGEFLPLSSTVHLVDYPEPVSYDVVTVNFRQLIDAFEGLHTGTYDKTITLTLKQTEL